MSKLPLFTLFCLCAALCACAATLPQTIPPQQAVQQLERYPFERLGAVLQARVDAQGRVDYAGLGRDARELERYGGLLAITGPRSSPALLPTPEDKLAWYLNAYNTMTLLNVLQRYPGLRSLEDIVPDFFYFTEFELDGETTDLYNLENGAIRPFARELYLRSAQGSKLGRIHFALHRASASSAWLLPQALTPDTLDQELERATRRFVADPRHVQVDEASRAVTLSALFKWYAADFTDNNGQRLNPLEWINIYRSAEQQLDPDYKVYFADYDWTLNDQAAR